MENRKQIHKVIEYNSNASSNSLVPLVQFRRTPKRKTMRKGK